MQEQSPEDMRRDAERLGEAADNSPNSAERKFLAARAFELAQQAELIERGLRGNKESPNKMTVYRCYFRNAAGVTIGTDLIRSETDEGAKRAALDLLRGRSEIRRVEVWRGADLAFRFSRFDIEERVHV
jgi:hypothetical protein